ncbi:hypothetical protein [Rhizobium sp. CF080]|nr:hypothetical protein [Rhizobium sp. CF080]
MCRRHKEILAAAWTPAYGILHYEVNAAFHEGIAAASGKPFLS